MRPLLLLGVFAFALVCIYQADSATTTTTDATTTTTDDTTTDDSDDTTTTTASSSTTCTNSCQRVRKPVCARVGGVKRTFINLCFMKAAKRCARIKGRKNVVFLHQNACTEVVRIRRRIVRRAIANRRRKANGLRRRTG